MSASAVAAGSISFVVTTKEGYGATAKLLQLLCSARRPDSEIILLTSADYRADAEDLSSMGVRIFEVPGGSIFHLRSRIPAACRRDWVFLIEDHAMADRQAIDSVYRLIEERPEIDLIPVLGKNLTSVTAWGWANFIQSFAFHWAPLADRPGSCLSTNVVVRRSKLGTEPLALGQWELSLIHKVFKAGRVAFSNEIWIDHIKHVGLASAFANHFHNGRACAGLLKQSGKSVVHRIRRAWRWYLRRKGLVQARIAPRRQELPAGLNWRLHTLGLAHFLGEVAGNCFGGGKSIQLLD